VAATVAAASPPSPPTTATTAEVTGRREPRDGSTAPSTADEAIVLGLALQRLQAHTPSARRIQAGSARALLTAHREGLTVDDLEVVCRWLTDAPGWAATLRERGQAVDSWARVLGTDWRGLVAQARRWEADGSPLVEAPRATGPPRGRHEAAASAADALDRLLDRQPDEVIDVYEARSDGGDQAAAARRLRPALLG
jgi:hypothetical protein